MPETTQLIDLHTIIARTGIKDGSGGAAVSELRFLDLKAVCGMIGVSKSTLYKMIREGTFPKACQVGANSVRWRSDEVTTWIMERPRAA